MIVYKCLINDHYYEVLCIFLSHMVSFCKEPSALRRDAAQTSDTQTAQPRPLGVTRGTGRVLQRVALLCDFISDASLVEVRC